MRDEAAFWAWSNATWPGVADLALRLQDEHGADVNLLLFCAWVGRLGAEELAAADVAVRAWRAEVLQPLRVARRGAAGTHLYERLKALELDAEREAQKRLVGAVPQPAGQNDALTLYCASLRLPVGLEKAVYRAFGRVDPR